MKKLLIACLLIVSAAAWSQRPIEKCLPKEIRKSISFGMSFDDFQRKNKVKEMNLTDEGFRRIYEQKINSKRISSVVYYIDTDNKQPLYEVIIIYRTAEMRDSAAQKLLGAPNYKGAEWKLEQPKGVPLYGWTFQTKLVLMRPFKDTEWDGDENL